MKRWVGIAAMLTVLSVASMTLGDGDRWPPSASASAGGMDRTINRRLSGMVWALGDAPVVPTECGAAMRQSVAQCTADRSCLIQAEERLALCEASGFWRE